MSSGIHAYVVSLNQIRAELAVPEKPPGVLARIFSFGRKDLIAEMKQRVPHILEDYGDDFDDDHLTIEQALHDLIAGNELMPGYASAYAHAFMAMCEYFGEFQDNSQWSPMRILWAEIVDAALIDAGVPQDSLGIIDHIIFRGAPISIPSSNDEPGVGYLLNAELPIAIKALEEADFSSTDTETLAAIHAVASWLKRAVELKCDLVCFYY